MNFQESNKAIYLQIADKICDDIIAGTLLPGGRIPSVREYAATLEVNANTVMRSYEHLERLGIIFNRRGIGFFIADRAAETVIGQRRKTLLEGGEAAYFFRQLMLLSITPEEVKAMYETFLTNNKQ